MARTPADVKLLLRGADRAPRAGRARPADRASAPTCTCARWSPTSSACSTARWRRSSDVRGALRPRRPAVPHVRVDPERRGRADPRAALPAAARRVRRGRRRPDRERAARHARRVHRGDRRARAHPRELPAHLHRRRRAAHARLGRPAGAARAAGPAGLPRRGAALHRAAGPRRACRRAPCPSASTTSACRWRSRSPGPPRSEARVLAAAEALFSATASARAGSSSPRDLRDQHPDLVHEAPAPVLARLERADDRVLARDARARSRACSASRRSSRRARTCRQMRRCSQTPPLARQSSQPATSSGSSVISIVIQVRAARHFCLVPRGAARRGRPCRRRRCRT